MGSNGEWIENLKKYLLREMHDKFQKMINMMEKIVN